MFFAQDGHGIPRIGVGGRGRQGKGRANTPTKKEKEKQTKGVVVAVLLSSLVHSFPSSLSFWPAQFVSFFSLKPLFWPAQFVLILWWGGETLSTRALPPPRLLQQQQ
jgi:hypothetical protein